MRAQVTCQECHRPVSCEELRLGVGGRKLCCDCHSEAVRSRPVQSRPDWRKVEEAEGAVALAEPPIAEGGPGPAGSPTEPY